MILLATPAPSGMLSGIWDSARREPSGESARTVRVWACDCSVMPLIRVSGVILPVPVMRNR
jgi:hypothetical protein